MGNIILFSLNKFSLETIVLLTDVSKEIVNVNIMFLKGKRMVISFKNAAQGIWSSNLAVCLLV